jgi:hypothetical protein
MMPENQVSFRTKTDAGSFPKGTEHVKIQDPYGVGYDGTMHSYMLPNGKEGRHIDYPKR